MLSRGAVGGPRNETKDAEKFRPGFPFEDFSRLCRRGKVICLGLSRFVRPECIYRRWLYGIMGNAVVRESPESGVEKLLSHIFR